MPTSKSKSALEERIKARAYDIWVRDGYPHGQHLAHWQRAEAEIAAESAPAARQPRAASTAKPAAKPTARKPAAKKPATRPSPRRKAAAAE